jgi:hypothetical protein
MLRVPHQSARLDGNLTIGIVAKMVRILMRTVATLPSASDGFGERAYFGFTVNLVSKHAEECLACD